MIFAWSLSRQPARSTRLCAQSQAGRLPITTTWQSFIPAMRHDTMTQSRSLTGLFADFRLLVILFIAFRLLLLLGYPPFNVQGNERGIGTGGDRVYHYMLSELAKDGLLPFRDWWSEFPPLW